MAGRDRGESDAAAQRKGKATLTVTMLSGVVDPLKCGSKVYVEIRLRDQIRRFCPVGVSPSTGSFSYDGLEGVQFNDNTLDEIFNDHLYVVLRSWHPTSDWTDAAQIVLPVRTIDMTASTEREFRSFILEPVTEEFCTEEEDKPSLVLSATLHSPFRHPVESVARLLHTYGTTVDLALDTVSQQTERIAPIFSSRAALIPAIPMGVFVLASLPLAIVLGVAGLPLLVPILAVVAVVGVAVIMAAGAVWAGSRKGRPWMQRMVKPVYEKVGKEDPEVLYPIGPRPSPARVIRSLAPTTMWPKLAVSLLVDFIGCTSYAVPILGEAADLVWAPMSYLIIDAMYHDSSPWAGLLGAMEELLPFTDIIPTATLAWMKEYIPVMLKHAAAGGVRMDGSHQQQNQRVYHSNGPVNADGVQYPSEPSQSN